MNSSKDVAENHSDESEKKSKSSTGKRKFHQKSRKGCSTCKKRRVKCDENKPSCNKCVHMKLDCGYLTDHLLYNRSEEEEEAEQQSKKRKVITKSPTLASDVSINSPETQQATPALTPSPPSLGHSDRKPLLEDDTPGRIPLFPKLYLSSNGNLDMSSSGSINSSNFEAAANAATIGSAGSNAAVPDLPSLLQAGNLNNINLSHLVNNLSGMGTDLSLLGNLANLSSLASLAQLPIDLSSISSFLELAPNLTGSLALIASQFQNSANTAQGSNPIIKEEDLGEQSNGGNDAQSNNGLDSSNNSGIPNISPNNNTTNPMSNPLAGAMNSSALNMLDLRLMFHYTSQVSNTITGAGISDTNIWNYDIPMLAFDHPFLMHAILAFSATHLSRTEKGLDQCVTCHRGDALRLLREAVLNINADNTDALVASALILIMDSLANASFPSSTSPKSLPALAWIFHVKGAATILTAVWPLTEASRFYKFISVDLGDIGEIINQKVHITKDGTGNNRYFTDLECHDSDIADLFPVEIDSPYLITLAYLNKLHKERYKSDFILRIFAFPALLDKSFLSLLMMGDIKAMRIMRSYYKLLRSFTTELKDKVWFLEGVSLVLPVDVEEYAGGAGGMTMMLDFLGGGPSIVDNNDLGDDIAKFDPQGLLATKLVDTDNLPSDITSNLEVMQGDDAGFIDMK